MEIVRLEETITIKDVERLNKEMPDIIEIPSTRKQDINLILKLDPKIRIRLVGNSKQTLAKGDKKPESSNKNVYSTEELAAVINKFKEIEGGINPAWTDLEAALYTYVELIKRVEHADESQLKEIRDGYNNLLSLAKGIALPEGFATVFQEAMDRIGIPCRTLDNGEGYAWNEIEIEGKYYPLDLASDSKFYRSEDSKGEIGICKFLTDKEFYADPNHKTKDLTEKELAEVRALDQEKVNKALENVLVDRRIIERPTIEVKSKELAEIFKGGQVSSDTIGEVKELKISIKDQDLETLTDDLVEIGRHYPELLSSVELENTSGSAINMQEVIDEMCNIRSVYSGNVDGTFPIGITISSSFEEDFDLDFSNIPEYNSKTGALVEEKKEPTVTLRSLAETPIKLPSMSGRLSSGVSRFHVEGFDLSDLDLTGSGIRTLGVISDRTTNIDKVKGFEQLTGIYAEALNVPDFNNLLRNVTSPSSNIHSIGIANQNFHDRKILQELSRSPQLVEIIINHSRMNDLDGLESFDGRLAMLALTHNELGLSDISRINTFWDTNPNAMIYINQNSRIQNAIRNAADISDESYELIGRHLYSSGVESTRRDKNGTVDLLLSNSKNIPYYLKDAHIIRRDLRITKNPMMLENDSEIDTVDFNLDYLRDGTLLLTIPQVERLISSGKVIPQDVRIAIQDVAELSGQRARDLITEMSNRGMNLSGVQVIDENSDNEKTQNTPYSMSQYIYIRETLDNLVAGINNTESDLDKFAVIYQRIMDHIVYDYPAQGEPHNAAEAMYQVEKLNTSRNLLEGLEEGKCVCAGYSDILRNALSLVGIDSRITTGYVTTPTGGGRHAWNQVLLDDGTGTKKWYYTDLTWDAGHNTYNWTLLGEPNFINPNSRRIVTQDIEIVEQNDYDRAAVRDAFSRARNRSFDFRQVSPAIDIPDDPQMDVEILDKDKIAAEYLRRKNDMLAKYYGDELYEDEYYERSERYYDHEIEVTDPSGITYYTIEDYPERERDEEFLLLDKYRESLERMTRYEAGDTSVYRGTTDQINAALARDREYVETRNHTFDQHEHTQRDLATLGKYGEKMPYIPRQQGVLKNVARTIGNGFIFTRNLVAPIYRGIGRFVAQPIHRLVTRGRDASPYKNNFYHRMVARREYFETVNHSQNPDQRIRNFIKSRAQAIFKSREGNEAVLKAGAADIRDNILNQERSKVLVQNLTTRISRFDAQIQALEQELANNPRALNAQDVRDAIDRKKSERDRIIGLRDFYQKNEIATEQTDAISDRQHAIASKEVNTMRVSVIKGVVKGAVVKYLGPKIHEWLLERGKVTRPIEVTTEVPETKQRWVDPTYKTETVPIYEEGLDTGKSMSDIMAANEGKEITGFYSVYGGERRPDTYILDGDEKITAIFQAKGSGGTGLSDTAGLRAPVFTNGTFTSDLLNGNGVLNQDTTLAELVAGLNSGAITPEMLDDLYVSVGDRYWTKLSELVEGLTEQVQVGEEIKTVLDVPGHMEEYVEMVEKVIQTTEVVTDPTFEKVVNASGKVVIGTIKAGGVVDIIENVRPTDTNVRTNKTQPRRYNDRRITEDMPKSKWEYER